ncbi:MAG: polyprenyl diphosphate synthase [Treponema sp.]|jgi:di-trans,poly-cis-decaprenylcistransferase|uniref:Isoprenyl transferase n=1 Tax=Treponema vincentii TaxID=69710 RepID=A0A6P1Y0W5_9SPIR|nr:MULTISPECIES: polyprenyl diphosphate synthase [Treponema]QHX43341.1 di-trans,poly-cis-decaprenylcistransferase [Treponema vincentii]UTC52161.1 di-trans,poly-cis-decaprenylcistransferase [Treponema sp. OMZ 803]UTC54564.1 di-trans,poly-cis-decaprenylcistransferase [Treponema sp. OMZ 906]
MTVQHIAVIMDGNGRWAQQRGLARTKGHREGLEAAKRIVKTVADLHIPYITLYVFSTENWKRTEEEVGFLMGLIQQHLRAELAFYAANNIKVKHIGNAAALPRAIQMDIADIMKKTEHYTGTTMQLAINYGGKDEIIRAIKKLSGRQLETLTEDAFEQLLDTAGVPPVDLVIRTGGEKRLSNFLLWQTAYAEFYSTDILWPDFTPAHLMEALDAYGKRIRRFGRIV